MDAFLDRCAGWWRVLRRANDPTAYLLRDSRIHAARAWQRAERRRLAQARLARTTVAREARRLHLRRERLAAFWRRVGLWPAR